MRSAVLRGAIPVGVAVFISVLCGLGRAESQGQGSSSESACVAKAWKETFLPVFDDLNRGRTSKRGGVQHVTGPTEGTWADKIDCGVDGEENDRRNVTSHGLECIITIPDSSPKRIAFVASATSKLLSTVEPEMPKHCPGCRFNVTCTIDAPETVRRSSGRVVLKGVTDTWVREGDKIECTFSVKDSKEKTEGGGNESGVAFLEAQSLSCRELGPKQACYGTM